MEEFNALRDEKGIERHLKILKNIPKRISRTLLAMVRPVMASANLSIFFWDDTLLTTIYVPNKVPSKYLSKNSYELWIGREPDLIHL